MTIPDPPKYNANNALAINICVTGSVEGVMTAANIVETTTTYFQAASIFLPDTIPNKPKIIWITGTWKAKPVVNIKTSWFERLPSGSCLTLSKISFYLPLGGRQQSSEC